MDYSQYIRLKQEAANVYLARNKPIDSSFLTMQKQQKAAFSGSSRLKIAPYFKGTPTLNPIIYDISSCPIDHEFTQGYTNSLKLSQQEGIASEKAGSVLCCGPDYSTAPSHIILLNPSTCSTILASNNTNPLLPRPIGFVPSVFQPQAIDLSSIMPKNIPSMYFDGGAFIQCPVDNVYSGISDFTIEFFVRPSSSVRTSPIQTLFYIGRPAIAHTYKFIGSLVATVPGKKYTMAVQISNIGTYTFGELLPNEWHHVAVMRFGNVMYFYVNGFMLNYKNIPQNIPSNPAATNPSIGHTTYLSGDESIMTIGAKYTGPSSVAPYGITDSFVGHMTNFRWTKGMAVYTEPIGVPYVVTLKTAFKLPDIPLLVYSRSDASTPLFPYVSVGLLAESEANVISNTCSPTAPRQLSDSSTITSNFNSVAWEKI